METNLLLLLLGFLSGLLYAGSIYGRAKKGKNPLLTFPIRFLLTALFMFLIGEKFGVKGLVIFALSHAFAVLIFTAYVAFLKP